MLLYQPILQTTAEDLMRSKPVRVGSTSWRMLVCSEGRSSSMGPAALSVGSRSTFVDNARRVVCATPH